MMLKASWNPYSWVWLSQWLTVHGLSGVTNRELGETFSPAERRFRVSRRILRAARSAFISAGSKPVRCCSSDRVQSCSVSNCKRVNGSTRRRERWWPFLLYFMGANFLSGLVETCALPCPSKCGILTAGGSAHKRFPFLLRGFQYSIAGGRLDTMR